MILEYGVKKNGTVFIKQFKDNKLVRKLVRTSSKQYMTFFDTNPRVCAGIVVKDLFRGNEIFIVPKHKLKGLSKLFISMVAKFKGKQFVDVCPASVTPVDEAMEMLLIPSHGFRDTPFIQELIKQLRFIWINNGLLKQRQEIGRREFDKLNQELSK